jgi:hypothetical protein
MSPEPPVLHVPFSYLKSLDAPEFAELMTANDMALIARRDRSDLREWEWESTDPDYEVTLTLVRHKAIKDSGCAFFAGRDRFDLAVCFVSLLHFVPHEALHLLARADTDTASRLAALDCLKLVHLPDNGVSYWDAMVDETVRILLKDPSPEVQYRALEAEVFGNGAAALQHIDELLAQETDDAARRKLADLRAGAEVASRKAPVVRFEDTAPRELRLAFPIYSEASVETIARRFSGACSVGQTSTLEIDGGSRLVELQANDRDARLTCAVSTVSSVGGTYFSGADGMRFVLDVSHLVHYFPVELAKICAFYCQRGALRVRAISALVFAATEKLLPGSGVDPEIYTVLKDALSDVDPAAQLAAQAALLMLGEELTPRTNL